MRVISGTAKGFKLKAPAGLETRPTTDRIKESLFNIIASEIYEINFLDLFSGSGSIGIEALSRGAEKAVFVDNSNESINIIKHNLEFTKLNNKSIIIKSDVYSAINRLNRDNIKFDIIFMDPPYKEKLIYNTLKTIYENNILKNEGFIIAEQSSKDEIPCIDYFDVFKVKEYKTTKMLFFKISEDCL